MPKEDKTTETTETTETTATDTATATATDTADTNETANETAQADAFAPLGHYVPSPEDRRQRALELAIGYQGGEHKEPFNAVLARAKAYHAYVNDGTLPAGV